MHCGQRILYTFWFITKFLHFMLADVGIIAGNDTAELCLTAEEEVTFYSDRKRWAGLRAVSFLFIHCDG